MAEISFDDFTKVDIRLGRIVNAAPYPEARKPAIKLWIDFGAELGVKKSSAQITQHYEPDQLFGKQRYQLCLVQSQRPDSRYNYLSLHAG